MVTSEDFESLQKILGTSLVPQAVLAECEKWTDMYHAVNSGPIGLIALICLLRQMGTAPQIKAAQAQAWVNWDEYPQDGTVRVVVRLAGAWCPGYFCGFTPTGALAIRVDHQDWVQEVSRDRVQLSDEPAASEQAQAVVMQLSTVKEPAATEDVIPVYAADEDADPARVIYQPAGHPDDISGAVLLAKNEDGSCSIRLDNGTELSVPQDDVIAD